MKSHYLNTDLELEADFELSLLASKLEGGGLFLLNRVSSQQGGYWRTAFQAEAQFYEPEGSILAILDVVEALDPRSRAL